MITLSRLNGQVVAINPDLITWIEITPDTTVSLVGGERIIVREPLDRVIERIVEFKRAVSSAASSYEGVLERLSRSSSDRPRSPSDRPRPASDRPPPATAESQNSSSAFRR